MNKTYINGCLRWLANEVMPFYSSGQLPDALTEKVDTFYRAVSSSIDWFNLTSSDMRKLGFLNCAETEEEVNDSVWFIPQWLFPAIPEGILLYDKNNVSFVFHKATAPKDVFYGCLTFGILMNPEEELEDGQV